MEDVRDRLSKAIEPVQEIGWQPRVYAVGGIVGLALGLLSAHLYIRSTEENPVAAATEPVTPSAGDAVRLGVALLGIVRTVTEWGARK